MVELTRTAYLRPMSLMDDALLTSLGVELDARGMWVDPGPIQGGVEPYVVQCADDGNPMLAPDDEMWLESEGMESLPPAMRTPTEAHDRAAETKIRMFRLPTPADAT